MSESMQNNRMHHRDWYEKVIRQLQSSNDRCKQGIVAGFEYAIQPDGSSLAERQWEVRRNPTALQLEFTSSIKGVTDGLYQTSLQAIESSIAGSSRRNQQKSAYLENEKSKDGTMPTYPEGPAFLSPTRRIRNRHNAVYGQHLPNGLNSPGCAMKVFGNQGIQKDERDRIKSLLNESGGRNHNKENLPPQYPKKPTKFDMDIDVDDEFLAGIDLDHLIAQRGKHQLATQTAQIEFDHGVSNFHDGVYNRRSSFSELSVARAEYFSSKNYDTTSCNNNQTRVSHNSKGISGDTGSLGGTLSSPSMSYPDCEPPKASNSSDLTLGADKKSSFISFVDKGESCLEARNCVSHTDGRSSSGALLPFHTAQHETQLYSVASTAFMPSVGSSSDTPLCSGHNRPCRLLTANTSANAGRQFYKCQMPDGDQCDFFEWTNGQEGNWNNNEDFGDAHGSMYGDGSRILDIYQENRRKFGHITFRPGQKDVIEHAMKGQDVFVLMPTGGGKSLCYQLPAWCSPGLSIVISPLLSLIQDQVQSLTKLGVQSVFLNSAQDYETEQKVITARLFQATDHGGIKLLYITPEKLRHSNIIQNILKKLYERNLLSRFVVDEAHCMSDWAHDFRPDYGQLGMLRREFPNVPMMALTATANEKVVNDAIKALGMKNEYRFKSSFNRPNLHYEVRKKDGKSIEKIGEFIVSRPQDSGVIYCLSRKDCETVSEALQQKLNEKGCGHVRVSFYHAELDDQERTRRHHAWSSGKISVLCATIAFGMGIDKPDVRFVIHFSMPKSITHYYQESGRAGRDGAKADCILYYAYKDKKVLETMIRKGSNNPNNQSTRRKIDQLYTCLRYCENEFICRRTMQLEFFGEKFEKANCGKTCDNCKAGLEAERRNLTSVACQMLQLLQDISSQKNGRGVTMVQLTEIYKGSKSKSATKFLNVERLTGCGKGRAYSKSDLDRIAHAMIFDKILLETPEQNGGGYTADYITPGENALATQNGQRQFFVEFPRSIPKAVCAKKEAKSKKLTPTKGRTLKEANKSGQGRKPLNGPHAMSDWEVSDGESGVDDNAEIENRKTVSKATVAPRVLPLKETQALVARIKKLVGMWADEEQMNGNRVFYWNIISHDATAAICDEVPTTVAELHGLGVLGENVVNEYGERLVKNINAFIVTENLQKYIDKRPLKRPKTSDFRDRTINSSSITTGNPAFVASLSTEGQEVDEFDSEIDFGAITLPPGA